MKKTKIVMFFLFLLGVTTWNLWPCSEKSMKAPSKILVNRLWMNTLPLSEKDKVDIFLMLDEPEIGMFSRSSAYEGNWSLFNWSMSKSLKITMMQDEKSYTLKTKVMRGKECAPFDYCFKMKGAPRGAKRYGSMEDWIIAGHPSKLPAPQELIAEFLKSKI